MTTLQGRHPLITIRTRSRQPASLLTVVLVAAATLGAAVALAFAIQDDDPPAVPAADVPAAQVATPPASPDTRAGVLTPRVTEQPPASPSTRAGVLSPRVTEQPHAVSGTRYDGGPEEGSRGAVSSSSEQSQSSSGLILGGSQP